MSSNLLQKLIWMLHAAFVLAMLPMALTDTWGWSPIHVALIAAAVLLMLVKALNKPSKLEQIHCRH